ncbi:hypothetical protein BKA70DRAFT_1223707 [Coprinopsis sp. MPI-PUGE-AT-0042]|nr:hypothetical protein BKA70DRAFT_1223707 [Coprinopsis sp. MPI-PUGE-AT-0042]
MSNLMRKLSIPKPKASADIEKVSNRAPPSKPVDAHKSRAPKPDKQPVMYQLQPPEPKLRHRAASVSTTTAVIVPVPVVVPEPKDELAAFSMQLGDVRKFIAEQQKVRVEQEALQRATALHQELYKKKKASDAARHGLRPRSPMKNRR